MAVVKNWRTGLALAISGLSLAGCATNALRLDYATDLAAEGHATALASSAFLDRVEDARIAANIELATSDPNCLPLTAHLRERPDLSRMGAMGEPLRGWLCAQGPEPGTVALSMAPLSDELLPTIELIRALGEYSDSIADILAQDGSQDAADFADTLALLGAAADTATALGMVPEGSGFPGAADPRLPAIADFVAIVTELSAEQRKVDQLRLLATSTTGSAELISTLEDHLMLWDLSRRADISVHSTLASEMMGQAFRAEPPAIAATRRELVTAYYMRERGAREELRAYRVIGGMLASLAAADNDLRRVLRENPDLTAEERAERARELRARVTRAFETATALLTAF